MLLEDGQMKVFAITYPNTDTEGNTNGRGHEISKLIAELFEVVCCEYDDGLSFIRSNLDASEILSQIELSVDLCLSETVYVMQLNADFSAHGTSNVIRALKDGLEKI